MCLSSPWILCAAVSLLCVTVIDDPKLWQIGRFENVETLVLSAK
jgi:hypothetical protein